MDLGAYANIQFLEDYVEKHYGKVPRLRGIRLMKLEEPEGESDGRQMDVFNGYCGKDVIYIHTRCGSAGYGDDDPDSNYRFCGADKWEEANSDLFIESLNDEFDGTYRDHYFTAVIDDEYNRLIEAGKGDA